MRAREPDRWERFLLRRRQEEAAQEESEAPVVPDAEDAPAEDASLFGGWEHREQDEVAEPSSIPTPSGGLDAAQPVSVVDYVRSIDVCEVFSPPTVSQEAVNQGLEVGDAMDLTTGWDFNLESHRRQAEAYVDEQKPLVLIGSPPCVAFSQLQALIPDSQRKARQLAEGIRHMEFVAKLYKKQIEAGRLFLHEQPAHARSWALPCIRNILREAGVEVAEADQCMYGLKTWGKTKECLVLAKKPTRFMTNSKALGRELSRRCDGQHEHQFSPGRKSEGCRSIPSSPV